MVSIIVVLARSSDQRLWSRRSKRIWSKDIKASRNICQTHWPEKKKWLCHTSLSTTNLMSKRHNQVATMSIRDRQISSK